MTAPSHRRAAEPTLTKCQIEVLELLAEDLTANETAKRLGISEKTVEFHQSQIYDRLQLAGLAGAVRYAIRKRIIEA